MDNSTKGVVGISLFLQRVSHGPGPMHRGGGILKDCVDVDRPIWEIQKIGSQNSCRMGLTSPREQERFDKLLLMRSRKRWDLKRGTRDLQLQLQLSQRKHLRLSGTCYISS